MEDPPADRLSGTEAEQPELYVKDKGSAQIHGQIFEYKFCAMVFLRATNKGYKFKLASNVKGLGVFDDVVVEYLDGNSRKLHIFVQLKSKARRPITMSQLKSKDGDFSLRKYYESYIKVEKTFNSNEEGVKMDGSIDDSLFIIYSNADVGQELSSKKVSDNCEEFLMTGGTVLHFNEEEHKAIYQHLQELPKHREFLSRFRIFYRQADEKEMDYYIKRELQQNMMLPDSELELAYMCFHDFIKDWWQHCNYFLRENNRRENDPLRYTSDKVRTTLVAKILDQRKSELDDLSIKYKESAITDMEQLTEPHKAVLIFAPGRSTTLTAAKIHQMLSATKHIILNLQQLVRYKTEVMLAWKNKFDVLVLESQSSIENFQDVLNEISMIQNECGEEKKFIFITHRMGNTEQISALRGTFSRKLREEYDDWIFSDIFTESTKSLLEKKVIFQGTEMKIKNLVKENDFRMLKALDCDSMSLLLANEKPSIGTPTEKTLKYYIDRSLESVRNFKSGDQTEGEILIQFRKENLEELQGTSSDMEKKRFVSDHGKGISKFSLANGNEKRTRKLCRGNATFHNLCTKDQTTLRRQCTDDYSNVQRDFQRKSSKVWRPNTLLDGEDRIILVTDDPGMGKSTLLTHLAMQTREHHTDLWIVRVNINNYTSILHGIKTSGFEENAVIKLLTEAAQIKETEGAQLEKQLFNYIYNSTGNMAVLIDGVDEVSPHYTEEVIQILRILSKTEIRKIWVTSRNSVRERLETEFQCQSYSLLPFSEEDQKLFLVKFWKVTCPEIYNDNLENLANRVVKLSTEHLTVQDKQFMGIPLQIWLLAEMFKRNLNEYSTSETVELPEHINIVMLYDLYVGKKWDIYLSDKKLSDRTNVNAQNDDVELHKSFMHNHRAAALVAILSTQQLEKLTDKTIAEGARVFLEKITSGVEKTGIIIEVTEGRPVFQHRTLAEYLAARWLCDNFQHGQTFMMDHIFESGFRVVRNMMDRILADKYPLHEAVLNSSLIQVEKLLRKKEYMPEKDRGGRTPLHVAVSCRSPELIKLLLEHGADVSSVDTLLGLSPVQFASRMADWELLSLLMEKRLDVREQVLSGTYRDCTDNIACALHAAAQYGHNDLLKYLISKGSSVNVVLPGDNRTLLHVAARSQQTETVKILLLQGASIDSQDESGKTPLHVSVETGNLEVIKCLVEHQETVQSEADLQNIVNPEKTVNRENILNVRDIDGNTPLHLGVAAGNKNIISYLVSSGSDLNTCNIQGDYPLALAARCGKNDIVELLMETELQCEEAQIGALRAVIVAGHVNTTSVLLGLGFPVNKGENEKPIHVASRLGREEIVSLLLQYGASLTSLTDTGNTALHLASEAGHLNLVKDLIEIDRGGLCSLNYENETPLHLAARNGRDYLVTYFAENCCNINAPSANGATCLHFACENGHYTTVECLLKHGAKVNAMNSADQTPLHIAASRGQTEIVELLLLHNENFSLRDKDGITALLAASINGHQDTVLFIVQHGGNIADNDGKGNTIAHFAVENENSDIINFLSQQNVSLDVQNCDGDTPLLKAVREGRNRMVQYLVERNCDINAQGNDGMLPLDVAVQKGNMEITRQLLERNARSGKASGHIVAAAIFGFLDLLQRFVDMGDDINTKADNGDSPLHAACKSGQLATIQYLCDHGALLDWQDNNGNTALHVAVSNGHLDAIRFLVEKGANLCAADISGSTALHIAAKVGHLNIVQYLADSFTPIDRRNVKNETALLVAAAEGHEKIVSVLIEQGAGIGLSDIEGKTALDIATEKGYGLIIHLLKDRAVSVLHTAALNGNLEELQCLVEAGIALDYCDPFGRTALWVAAKSGQKLIIRLLLKKGSCVNIPDCEGVKPTDIAVREGHWGAVNEFLKHDPDMRLEDTEILTNLLYEASESGDMDVIPIILKCGISINTTNNYGNTPLHVAAKSGHKEVTSLLLKCGANVNTADSDGKTPLIIAAENGLVEIVRVLLSATAVRELSTPLFSAAKEGHKEVVQELMNHGANVNTADKEGFTPLYVAGQDGHVEVVRELLTHGANVNTADEDGFTPLHAACQEGHVEVVRELLKHGANVNTADKDGDTPLYIAGQDGHVDVLRVLLNHGANVNAADEDGFNPLYAAGRKGHFEVVRELLNHGANVNTSIKDGFNPLQAASHEGHVEVVRELLNHGANVNTAIKDGFTPLHVAGHEGHVEVVRELLNHGANVNTADEDGFTPLYVACQNRHIEVVRELLIHGANVNTAFKDGFNPLYLASYEGQVEVVRELIKHGANVNTVIKDGVSPLHAAGQEGHVEVLRELLNHGANVNTADKDGDTPLYIAGREGHVEVVRELLNHGAQVDKSKKSGRMFISLAAEKGFLDLIREALK